MYTDRNHQLEMQIPLINAIMGLAPRTKRDLQVMLDFLWECDFSYEYIDLSRMKEEDLLAIDVADKEFIYTELHARRQAQLEADSLINDHRAEI